MKTNSKSNDRRAFYVAFASHKLVVFQVSGIHTLLKFSFQNRLLSYIWRDEVWLGARRELYAVSMGSIYSCLWMQLHSNSLKKACWTGYTMYLLIWTSFEKTTTIFLFLACFPEETWLKRSCSLYMYTHVSFSSQPLSALTSLNQIWQNF